MQLLVETVSFLHLRITYKLGTYEKSERRALGYKLGTYEDSERRALLTSGTRSETLKYEK